MPRQHPPGGDKPIVKRLITCDCLGSQQIDAQTLSEATGLVVDPPCRALCTDDIDAAASAIASGEAMIACQQEARAFGDLAEELGAPAPPLVDLRDRAGWTDDTAPLGSKMAALVAEALLAQPPVKTVDVASEGRCIILGPADVAGQAAEDLKEVLGVMLILPEGSAIPQDRDLDVVTGRLRRATGALGGFELRVDNVRQVIPGGRGDFGLSEPRDGARSECDILLDLSGGPALFPAPDKREGYLRADPAHPPSVAAAVLAASQLVGTFEKPLYVRVEPALCAHSRAEQTGCTRCLDLCPT
ncbi:MAG: (4Fe-4S)-binding protein, partial [Marinibacterium sp.]